MGGRWSWPGHAAASPRAPPVAARGDEIVGGGTEILLKAVCRISFGNSRPRTHAPRPSPDRREASVHVRHHGPPFRALPRRLLRDAQGADPDPFYGWYCARAGMIVVDRDAHAKAPCANWSTDARSRVSQARQVVIFPEGHRTPPAPKATTSRGSPPSTGTSDSAAPHGQPTQASTGPPTVSIRRPGTIVYEFLERYHRTAPGRIHRVRRSRIRDGFSGARTPVTSTNSRSILVGQIPSGAQVVDQIA